jgi:hypothetical protein
MSLMTEELASSVEFNSIDEIAETLYPLVEIVLRLTVSVDSQPISGPSLCAPVKPVGDPHPWPLLAEVFRDEILIILCV